MLLEYGKNGLAREARKGQWCPNCGKCLTGYTALEMARRHQSVLFEVLYEITDVLEPKFIGKLRDLDAFYDQSPLGFQNSMGVDDLLRRFLSGMFTELV